MGVVCNFLSVYALCEPTMYDIVHVSYSHPNSVVAVFVAAVAAVAAVVAVVAVVGVVHGC